MTTLILIYIPVHILCGVLAHGIEFAYWQRKYPELADRHREYDRRNSLATSISGPLGLLASVSYFGTKHGLKFK